MVLKNDHEKTFKYLGQSYIKIIIELKLKYVRWRYFYKKEILIQIQLILLRW